VTSIRLLTWVMSRPLVCKWNRQKYSTPLLCR
jgi:hypothetical protein